jgi:dTDP-4-dehydrorhamnose 3,5-epimerase
MIVGKRDQQTVTPESTSVVKLIAGVSIRSAPTILDERGEICEIYSPAWGISHDPLVYVYQILLRPGRIKGWVYHEHQDDRLFISMGTLKIVLFDMREGSPTEGLVNELYLSERNRGLVTIPKLVVHAVQNVGTIDAMFINLPTKPYNHLNPDKYRIPLDSTEIPYRFERGPGW